MEVEYLGFGEIDVSGERYEHDVVIENGRARKRDKKPSKGYRNDMGHTPLSAEEDIPWSAPRLVIGTGADGRLPVMAEVRDLAAERGVEVISMPTAEACRLLQGLEPHEAAAVLHVTC